MEGEARGGVQQLVAQRLGLADGEFAGEREPLGPGDEVLGDQRDLEPHGVVVKVAKWEVGRAGLLGGADAVLGAGAGAVPALKFDGVAVEVGQRDQEACPSWSVKLSWAPGCGRSRRTISRDPWGQPPRSTRR